MYNKKNNIALEYITVLPRPCSITSYSSTRTIALEYLT